MTTRTPTQAVQQWLGEFETALAQRDVERVTALFNEECYWRDLIA